MVEVDLKRTVIYVWDLPGFDGIEDSDGDDPEYVGTIEDLTLRAWERQQ